MLSSANSITDGAQRGVEVSRVFLAPQKILVRLEGSAGTCSGNDGYTERLALL